MFTNESGLYPPGFIREYGESSIHWNLESDRAKEVFLRHQMACVLLSNMQMSSDLEKTQTSSPDSGSPPSKRIRLGSLPSSSGSSASTMGIEEQNEPGVIINVAGCTLPEKPKAALRIIILEGDPFIDRAQNRICQENGFPSWDTKWDLYDRQLKRFIEVKVSMDLDGSLYRYELKKSQNPDHASLIVVNPESCKIDFIDHPGDLQGRRKAEDFFIRRKRAISNLGLMESTLSDYEDVISTIFCNPRSNKMVEDWISGFWPHRNRPIPFASLIPGPVTRVRETGYQIVQPDMILRRLEDPTLREGADYSQWNAKLPPITWLDCIEVTADKDHDMISEWLERFDFGEDCPVPWKIMRDHWNSLDEPSTFKLFTKKDRSKTEFTPVMELLGIGKKTTVLNVENSNTVQKEFKGPPLTKLHPCFSHVLKDLIEPLEGDQCTFFNVSRDTMVSEHPMAKLSGLLFDEIFLMFSKSVAGAQASMLSNLYSRLGGAYVSPETMGSKRSNIVWFPILYNSCDPLGNKSRKMAGICVRGPQHAKFGTDKINVAFILKYNQNGWNDFQREILFKKCAMWESSSGMWLSYRTALNKEDSSYLTFPLNSLFVVCNLYGEIMLNNEDRIDSSSLLNDGREDLLKHRDWYMDRMVEALSMGMMGGPQEEGALTGLRKLFMSMIAWSRQDPVSCISPDAFCDDINECLLNRPLAQHFVKQFIISLQSYDSQQRAFL